MADIVVISYPAVLKQMYANFAEWVFFHMPNLMLRSVCRVKPYHQVNCVCKVLQVKLVRDIQYFKYQLLGFGIHFPMKLRVAQV